MNPVTDRYVPTEIAGESELDQTVLFRLAPERWSELNDFLIDAAGKFDFNFAFYNSGGFVLRG